LQEVHDSQAAGRQADPQAQRRCALMFELSGNLERLLEFLASQLPGAFRAGSTLNLTRLVELLSFILSHTTGSGAAYSSCFGFWFAPKPLSASRASSSCSASLSATPSAAVRCHAFSFLWSWLPNLV